MSYAIDVQEGDREITFTDLDDLRHRASSGDLIRSTTRHSSTVYMVVYIYSPIRGEGQQGKQLLNLDRHDFEEPWEGFWPARKLRPGTTITMTVQD
jgi:hypothetical protein